MKIEKINIDKKKEKRANITVFLLLFAVTFLLCGANGCQEKEKLFNTQGLEMNFAENAPPLSVIVNQEFPIYVDIYNKGGAHIDAGKAKFYLTGIGPNLEDVSTDKANKVRLVKEASYERLIFAQTAKSTFSLENAFSLPLALVACYDYGTVVQVELCIGANTTRVCSIEGEKIVKGSNSAAPIQITSLKEEVVGNKLQVHFVIENRGKEQTQVFSPTLDCEKRRDLSESLKEGKVKIRINTKESGFACKLKNEDFADVLTLEGITDLGKVLCEKTLVGGEGHVIPFTIIVHYKYLDSITTKIDILPE